MKIVRDLLSVLFVISLVTGYGSVPANGQTTRPSVSGIYRFVRR